MIWPRTVEKHLKLSRTLFVAAFLILLSLSGYWVKCQLGVDVFPNFSWEQRFPLLGALQRTVRVSRPAVGAVFISTFDGLLPRYNWARIWARDADTATVSIVAAGFHSSNALLIRSASVRDWAFPSVMLLETNPGDTFDFSGYARTTAEATARMSVITFDALDKVIQWDYALTVVHGADWQLYANRFVVPEGTARVCFRLAGSGIGDTYFDDIAFVRVK